MTVAILSRDSPPGIFGQNMTDWNNNPKRNRKTESIKANVKMVYGFWLAKNELLNRRHCA